MLQLQERSLKVEATKMREVLSNPTDPNNQVAFLHNRIKELRKEIEGGGDFGRSELINMFMQIIISIDNRISSPGFVEQVLRNVKVQQDLTREYVRLADNRNMRDAAGVLMKLKKAWKELDGLLEQQINPGQ